VLATAVVAVAFQPVRVRVQQYANRLVYGARATPYEVLSEFASRMGRTRPATDQLSYMARTLAEGLGASRAEVWLRVGQDLAREAVWPPDDKVPAVVAVPDAVSENGAAGSDRLPALAADRVVAVRQEGELLGAIAVTKPAGESMTPAEEKLLDDVAAQAGLVLRNARLIEDLRSSRQRLVSAQDEERRRLERNLHDGAQQSFVAVALTLRMASGQLARSSPDAAQPFEAASEQLSEAIEELRELARGIHPAILTERGLGPAVNSLAERSPVPVIVADHLDGRAPAAVEATAYFVVAEALTNAAKHADASAVRVDLDRAGEQLIVSVADDGRGGVDPAQGSGLRGLTDRIAAADGDLQVDSTPGQGTRITCRLPLPRTRVPEPRGHVPTGTAAEMTAISGAEG
jgi:signal transduction histidine kinase